MSRPRVETAALFPELLDGLLELLRGLDEEPWRRPTVAGSWDVKDAASWRFERAGAGWGFADGAASGTATARLTLPADVAWRLFCKGVKPEQAERAGRLEGDVELCRAALGTVSVLG